LIGAGKCCASSWLWTFREVAALRHHGIVAEIEQQKEELESWNWTSSASTVMLMTCNDEWEKRQWNFFGVLGWRLGEGVKQAGQSQQQSPSRQPSTKVTLQHITAVEELISSML